MSPGCSSLSGQSHYRGEDQSREVVKGSLGAIRRPLFQGEDAASAAGNPPNLVRN